MKFLLGSLPRNGESGSMEVRLSEPKHFIIGELLFFLILMLTVILYPRGRH